jgi:Zn-dependent M16 (insulinase) family peptidase
MKSKPFHLRQLNAIIIFITMMSLSSACKHEPSYPGYRLIEKKFVKEVNADCYLFEHIKSGARVLKIAADDPNNTFSIAFKTIPESDAGTPHIMEHALLNGSKNFPVKSPFDVLSKGSLNTFLNAMTSDDFTVFPVASVNTKDYFNLMHVYLDAVFNPLIYSDPRIFMQEGWHYELNSKDSPLEYKGVVYNEMKGAFSSPERELWYQIQRNLFPDNGYRFSSGGYPSAIPSLTYDDFVSFHKRHYHPSNSYIFLYGNADLEQELAFIDKEYLSKYDKTDPGTDVKLNPPFTALKEAKANYPVIEGAPVDHQTYLAMNWVIGKGSDQATVIALNILADVLVNQESAPVRKALNEAGIGKDIYGAAQNMQQNIFSIVVQNANAADKDSFRSIIIKTLKKVVKEKIDREALQGSINRTEFRLREGDDAQKGIAYNMRSMTSWLFTNDPFPALEYETQLTQLKTSLTSTYLEDIIQKDLIDNPYGLVVTLEPKPGLEKENSKKITADLAAYKRKLAPKDVDTILKNTQDLVAYQKKEDSPEALATIPVLKISDINREATWYDVTSQKIDGVSQLYHNEFTNHIVYMNYWFDLRVLPQEMIPYAAVLSELLGKMDAGSYSYEKLDKALNINTGGFNTSLTAFLPDYDDNKMLPEFRIQMKTTTEKLDTSIRLLAEILTKTKLDNKDRLGELLRRHQSQVESDVTQNGYRVALNRLESYYSQRGVFNDMIRGASYYWFVTDLVKRYAADTAGVIAQLNQVKDALFTKNNLLAGTTSSEEDFKIYTKNLPLLSAALADKPVTYNTWLLKPEAKNEGIETASKVQYVLQGYDFRKLGLPWDGKWNVLSQVMSTDWLQTRIRVVGGAYGGFSGISKSGTFYLASYRDPNLKETLDNYQGTIDYLSKFQADSMTMTRYIIGTIANLDNLMTPSEKGELAFRRYMEKTSKEAIQKDRDAVLSTTPEDIRQMSSVLARVLGQQTYCVYGNEDKLKANKNLFKNLVTLQK